MSQVQQVDVYEEEDYQSALYGFSLCSKFDAEQAIGKCTGREGRESTRGRQI